jgi:endonuclease G
MSKNRLIYTTLLLVCVIGFWLFENFYTPAHYSNSDSGEAATPFVKELLPNSTHGAIVFHDYYLLSYSEPHEQAEWVAYTLEKSHLTYDDRKRPYFIEDPKVISKSADWRNYKGSGYDRGHLCPAGDRRFSEYAYNETFYTSNITPQDREFNAGVWNRLEIQIRQWCKRYGTLHIITGGVLNGRMDEIGDEDVDVPNAFYKIVVRRQGSVYKVLAFLIPHEESNKPLKAFLVPVDTLESLTGLDFFEDLNKGEEQLEKEVDDSGWKF